MRAKLKQSFSEQVPDTSVYQVGYFEKRHNKKHWIEDSDDLDCMYSSYQCSDTIKLYGVTGARRKVVGIHKKKVGKRRLLTQPRRMTKNTTSLSQQ